jgi:hypothetical protein
MIPTFEKRCTRSPLGFKRTTEFDPVSLTHRLPSGPSAIPPVDEARPVRSSTMYAPEGAGASNITTAAEIAINAIRLTVRPYARARGQVNARSTNLASTGNISSVGWPR